MNHPTANELQHAIDEISRWLLDDFRKLPSNSVGQTASRAQMEALLREPAPEDGQVPAAVVHQFLEKIAPWALRPGHPRFWAFIPSAPSMASVLGDWLCAATNFFCGVWKEAPAPAQIEILVLDWFKAFLGYPGEASGVLTGGGSEANLLALVAARETLDFEERSRAVLYMSEQRHWSVNRAAMIMGLAAEQLRTLPADADGRLIFETLRAAVEEDRRQGLRPWALVANAGTTNTGAVDPLRQLAHFCRQQALWLHVDAAYGWPAVLTVWGKKLLDGIALADSITLDPHKWFAQTFDVGCLLMRDGQRLAQTFALRPEYMQDVVPEADEVNFADHGLALTRRFRALKIWLSIKVLGVGWFRELVEHGCRLTEVAQTLLLQTGRFEILHQPQLSILCFRYVPGGLPAEDAGRERLLDELNQALFEDVLKTGQVFLSTTRWQGRLALRVCFVNWRTTEEDIRAGVELLMKLGDERAAGHVTPSPSLSPSPSRPDLPA